MAAGARRRAFRIRRRVQLCEWHLPPLLRVVPGAVRGRVRRCGGRARARAAAVRAASLRSRSPAARSPSWWCSARPGDSSRGRSRWWSPSVDAAPSRSGSGGRRGCARCWSARRSLRCWRRPLVWAAETLGHPTSATFPTGGPASAAAGGPGGGPGGSDASPPGGFAGRPPGGFAGRPGGFAGRPPGGFAGPPSGAGVRGAGARAGGKIFF